MGNKSLTGSFPRLLSYISIVPASYRKAKAPPPVHRVKVHGTEDTHVILEISAEQETKFTEIKSYL